MDSRQVHAILEQIAAEPSRNEKERILGEHIADPLFVRVLKLAADTFITFGITPPKVKKFGSQVFDMDSTGLWDGLDQLATRKLTGNAAKAWVKEALETFDEPSSNVLWRILSKDLRAGFGKNTVNRVLPGTIVTFDVMLSKAYEAKRIKSWPVAGEPKLDGLRAMSLCKDGQSKAFSRVGNHFPALDHLSGPVSAMVQTAWERAKEVAAATPIIAGAPPSTAFLYYRMLGGAAGPTLALDAEAITGGFNKTSGDVKRKSVAAEDVVLHVFDAVPYDLLTSDEHPTIAIPYKVRRAFVEFVVGCAAEDAPIVHTPMELCHSDEEIMALYQKHRDAGLEGAMVKPLDSQYVKKKTHNWMKIKAEETEDLRIVGWFEGEAGTRLDDKFAGWLAEREHEGAMVDVSVGGGFSHELLAELDTLVRTMPSGEPYEVRGKIRRKFVTPFRLIEVEYHEVTPDGSLRHPRFVRYRDDKDENLKAAA